MRGIYPLVSEKENKEFVGAYPRSFRQVKNKKEKEIKSMKRMKKITSILLAVVMVLGMSLTVFAADNHPHIITIKQNTDDKTVHQYAAYQVFMGDLADNPDYDENDNEPKVPQYILSNIDWGSGVDGDAILAELKADADDVFSGAFKNATTAADVARALSVFNNTFNNKSGALDYFARIVEKHLTPAYESVSGSGNVEIEVFGSGYYLVKDITDSVESEGAYTRALLEVVGDSQMVVKSEVPSGDKKVYIDDVTTGDANNASIGSHVSYEITSKVPNYAGYNYYYFIMNDTLSEGLTFDGAESLAVKVGDKTLSEGSDYYIYTHHHTEDCYGSDVDSEGNLVATCGEKDVTPYTFRLAFANIMDYEVDADIVVTYSATVNDKAIVGTTGNPNTWNLQYSNNPDDTFDGERPDGENTPGLPDDEESEALGQTPDEKTLTYVTELDITKYANEVAADHLLAGAEFTLTGVSKQVVLSEVEYYRLATLEDTNREARYYLLLDGTYTAQAPTDTKYVEIGVGTDTTEKGFIKDAEGNYIVPQNKADYVGETLYKLVKGTNSLYADPNTTYVRVVEEKIGYKDMPISIEMTTGEDGKISFKDLGAGEYTLTETITPDGFNTIDPIKFTISFKAPASVSDGTEKCEWSIDWTAAKDTGLNAEGEGVATGIFAADVINNSGSLLPSTGGIGTTIFYVVGAILVIGAGILLVAKKRMSNR